MGFGSSKSLWLENPALMLDWSRVELCGIGGWYTPFKDLLVFFTLQKCTAAVIVRGSMTGRCGKA